MESMSNCGTDSGQLALAGAPGNDRAAQVEEGPRAQRAERSGQNRVYSRGVSTDVVPTDPLQRQALFEEFTPLVRKLIGQYGDDPDLRQDLLGEIYYRFCKLLNAYEPDREVPLRAYLVRQLIVSTYTFARHRWRERQREIGYEELPVWSSMDLRHDPTSDWDNALAMQHLGRLLPTALAKLPARQKKVVIWRYFDEMPFEEIAGNLGVLSATARSLLRHALNNLRRHFAASQLS